MKQYKARLCASVAAVALLGMLAAGVLGARPQTETKEKSQENTATKPAVKDRDTTRGSREDEQAIRKQANAYSAALNKGDLDALLSYWAPDADYADETGKVYKGQAALRDLFSKALKEIKGSRMRLQTQSLRFVRPEVALEDGSATCTSPEGTRHSCRYSAVWVKSDGKWLLNSVRDLSPETEATDAGPYRQLRELEWLVGDWKSEDKNVNVHVKVHWAPHRSFLLMEHEGRKSTGEALDVQQRVGWDPVARQFHSWFFDSMGGFGEAAWKRDGNQWDVKTSGVLPDGRKGSSINSYQFVDENHYTWRSRNRQVDGLPTPDVEVKFVRVTNK